VQKEDKFQFHPKVVEEDNHQILPYYVVVNYVNKEEKTRLELDTLENLTNKNKT